MRNPTKENLRSAIGMECVFHFSISEEKKTKKRGCPLKHYISKYITIIIIVCVCFMQVSPLQHLDCHVLSQDKSKKRYLNVLLEITFTLTRVPKYMNAFFIFCVYRFFCCFFFVYLYAHAILLVCKCNMSGTIL